MIKLLLWPLIPKYWEQYEPKTDFGVIMLIVFHPALSWTLLLLIVGAIIFN